MKKVACLAVAVLLCLYVSGTEATLGDACTDNANCTISNSECSSNVCACSTGFVESGGACLTAVSLGGNCSIDNTSCSADNSECSSGLCACSTGFVADNTNTTCGAVIGMSCTDDADCTDELDHTACTSSACACASGYEESSDVCVKETASAADINVHSLLVITLLLLGCHMF